MNLNLYPPNWRDIALQVKEAANWTCQNCGKPCRRPGESIEALAERLEELAPIPPNFSKVPGVSQSKNHWLHILFEETSDDEMGPVLVAKPNRFKLTVAHINHDPSDCRPENLVAWCTPCHARHDISPPQRAIKRRLKLERQGQLTLQLGA